MKRLSNTDQNSATLINVPAPSSGGDAVNKTYADGKVADAINDGTTTIAPSQNAVFDALALKQPLDSDLTTIAGLTATTDNFMVAASSAWASRTPAQAKTSLSLVKGDVGLGNVDNTADSAKPVSTAEQTALDLKANIASPTLTGTPAAPTAAAATNTTQIATTAHVFAERTNSATLTNKTLTSPVIDQFGTASGLGAAWTSYAPTITGFSANPASGLYYYKQIGKTIILTIRQPNLGTSNATTFTITLPVAAVTRTNARWSAPIAAVNNTADLANPGFAIIDSAATTVVLYTSYGGTVWTSSGSKALRDMTIIYEVA